MLPSALLIIFLLFFTACFVATFLIKKNYDANKNLDERNRALVASRRLNQIILESLNFNEVIQKIADTIPSELYFGTAVVAILDAKKQVIRRVAVSQTEEGLEAIKALNVPFKDIEISVDDPDNLMSKALKTGKTFKTNKVYDVLRPVISPENSDIVQNIMKTKTTLVYPLFGSHGKAIGVFLASTSKNSEELSPYELGMIQEFVSGVGIAMEHALIYEELKSLDKMKDQLIAVASHELRTPASIVQNYLWRVTTKPKEGTVFSSEDKKDLEKAFIGTQELIKLISDILNVSRIEGGKMEINVASSDYPKITKEVIDELNPKASRKGLSLKCDFKPDIKQAVLADPTMLKEILTNLITNAIKYSDLGEILVTAEEREGNIVFSIKDNGRGVAEENIPKLFQMFYREDTSLSASNSETGGTGLGLYITKSMVCLMKGKIWVESKKGIGSIFYFSLPASTSTPNHIDTNPIAESVKSSPPTILEDKKRLLIVEDSAEMRTFYTEILSEKFNVETAVDGEDGLNKLKLSTYDLILLDVMMPKVDGLGFMQDKQIDPEKAKIPVILLTNLGKEETINKCFELGAKSMIIKSDVLPDQLITAVEEELKKVYND